MGAKAATISLPWERVTDQKQLVPLMSLGVAQCTQPVLIRSLFCPEEIERVKALSKEMPQHIRNNNSTCWITRYLHTNGKFKEKAPALLAKLKEAAMVADSSPEGWGLLRGIKTPKRLQPRVIEHHIVSEGGSLHDPFHYDEGSILTIDVMLADPDVDFEGGKFCTMEGPGEFRTHLFGKGDALVFVSHKYHCIKPVLNGLREVLVMELWEGRACQCAHRCEVRWGTCAHVLDK